MSKELDAFKKIAEIHGNTGSLEGTYEYFLTIKRGLERLEAIDNANPSEALECLDRIDNTLCLNNIKGKLEFGIDTEEHTDCNSAISMTEDLETIKQALMERIVWKHIHNTKVKIPLCDVFNNPVPLSKEERYKYIEHIYYHWEEMKEALEEQNKQLVEENIELKKKSNKHYLKWEDLEFTRDEKVMIVKMGDTVYKILYRCCDGIEEVQLLSEDEKLLVINLIGKYKDNIQVFNDLHLERVEE